MLMIEDYPGDEDQSAEHVLMEVLSAVAGTHGVKTASDIVRSVSVSWWLDWAHGHLMALPLMCARCQAWALCKDGACLTCGGPVEMPVRDTSNDPF